jgi:hypothetical protein
MTDCIVILKLTLAQPVSKEEQTRRMIEAILKPSSEGGGLAGLLGKMPDIKENELEFQMTYSSEADFQTDGRHQFFNEAHAAAREQGKVSYHNRVVSVTFLRRVPL